MKPAHLSWSDYVRLGMGRRLSRIGEVLGIEKLVYNSFSFQSFHEDAVANAPGVISAIRKVFPNCLKLADVGCGSGAYAAEAIKQGLSVVAWEYSTYGRKMALRQGIECRPFNLKKSSPALLDERIDLAFCFEVAEHLGQELGEQLVEFLANLSPVIIFSAAQPGQPGVGHINLRPLSYWVERFSMKGCSLSEVLTKSLVDEFSRQKVIAFWLLRNVMVFEQNRASEKEIL